MSLNLGNPDELFLELKEHVGHTLVCVEYGAGENVTIECETCDTVLVEATEPANEEDK